VRKALYLLVCLWSFTALAQYEDIQNPGTVSAVQERMYRMHHELTLGVGVLPADAFYKGLMVQVAYTAHFTDSFAWQVGRAFYSLDFNTGLKNQLEQSFGASPVNFDEVQYAIGSDLMWTPLYGKITWLNQTVTHLEFYGLLGGTVLKLSQAGFRPAINLGIGGRVYANKVLSFRLEVTDNIVVSPDRAFLNVLTVQLSCAVNFGAYE
jgi:outer membrane beta-barrel protein